ncbi:hypothetical protein HDU76_005087, partial [Blyttiomyces sp. JEL0837]
SFHAILFLVVFSAAILTAQSATTTPITFPRNQYYVTSNLIAAIEYLHRAFPSHPSVYTQSGNFVYHYVDPISGNVTDLVDPSDLFLNAKTLNDVVVGVETVMFNQIPNPDTDPVTSDVIANLKIATNFITNIASYDFSSSDQSNIYSFYNFTATRYKNLFSRENTTTLIPYTPLSLTNNVNATSAPTPLLYNLTVFDAIDGNTYNNTLNGDPRVIASNIMNAMARTLQTFGIPVTVINGTNTTTTTTSAVITPPPQSTTQYTSAEPTVIDTNDPCGFDGCFRRRRRQNHLKRAGGLLDGVEIRTYGTFPSNPSSGQTSTVSDVTNAITFQQGGTIIEQGLTDFAGAVGPAESSQVAISLRSNIAAAFRKAAKGSKDLAKATGSTALKGITTAIKEGFAEAAKGTAIGGAAKFGLVKAMGVVAADLVENLGEAASPLVNDVLAGAEKTAITTAMTEFFGFPSNLAEEAVGVALSRDDYADSTTLTKTKLAIGIALSKAPEGAFPEFNDGAIEDWVGRRMDKIIQKKYGNTNINRNSKIVGEGRGIDKFPNTEFDSLRTVLEGVTDKVPTTVEFDEAKFLGSLGDSPEGTFGYHITASKGIDDAVTTIAALVTDNSVTSKDNAGFISEAVTAVGGSSDKLVSKIKSTVLGKQALRNLGKNAVRTQTDNGQGELHMDANAQAICKSLGDSAFSGMTKNVRGQLKTSVGRTASTKASVRNTSRTIFRNLAPKK